MSASRFRSSLLAVVLTAFAATTALARVGRPIEHRPALFGCPVDVGLDQILAVEQVHELVAEDLLLLKNRIGDEVDSILIDEARTPLIISGQAEQSADQYRVLVRLAPMLSLDEDYLLDEKARSVTLTESGIAKAEKFGAANHVALAAT